MVRLKGQGALEYVLLIGGMLLVTIVVVSIIRNQVIPATNQSITGGVNAYNQSLYGLLNATATATPNAPPSISLSSPLSSASLLLAGNQSFNYTPSEDVRLKNATLWGNFSGTWAASISNSSPLSNASVNSLNLSVSNNTYLWNVQVCDSASQCVFATSNFSLTLRAEGQTALLAGSTNGYTEGTGSAAQFGYPRYVAVNGNYLYVSDHDNNVIRRIDLTTNATSLIAGSGSTGYTEGTGSAAEFNQPHGIDVSGNYLYVADAGNHKIRKIDLTTNATSLVAGSTFGYSEGTGSGAQFDTPFDVAVSGIYLYVADSYNQRIRRIDLTSNATSLIAGSGSISYAEGTGSAASFNYPYGIDVNGNYLYVSDTYNDRIRKIDLSTNATSLIAGSGTYSYAEGVGSAAHFRNPRDLDTSGNFLYLVDYGNKRVRRIDLTTTTTSLIAGSTSGYTEGTGSGAQFDDPYGIAISGNYLYVADAYNNRIRRIG